MPRVDFSKIDKTLKFTAVPPGKYRCRIVKVDVGTTKTDREFWKVRLEVLEGRHVGHLIFDNVIFSGRGFERVECICRAVGIDTTGAVDLTPESLVGRSCVVETDVEEFTDRQGRRREGNQVKFLGYSPANNLERTKPEETSDGDLPF
jgi:hypothetical protein